MGPPQGERAPRVGPISIVILDGFHTGQVDGELKRKTDEEEGGGNEEEPLSKRARPEPPE